MSTLKFNHMRKAIITFCLMLAAGAMYAQTSHEKLDSSEAEAVKHVLKKYKDALENLDASTTPQLFSADAAVFENGGFEGTYIQYLDHHLGPELGHFKEFKFNNYKVNVQVKGNMAVAYETYTYKIVTGGENSQTIERKGVATSVLEKIDGTWKILQYHSSARTPKKAVK